MATTYIYGLVDPRDGLTKYVGKSDDPEQRKKAHLIDGINQAKHDWFTELASMGLEPELEILAEVDKKVWSEEERLWIDRMSKEGHPLCNIVHGCTAVRKERDPSLPTKKVISIRLSEQQEAMVDRLTEAYRLDRTSLILRALEYVDRHEPTFQIIPAGKGLALNAAMMN